MNSQETALLSRGMDSVIFSSQSFLLAEVHDIWGEAGFPLVDACKTPRAGVQSNWLCSLQVHTNGVLRLCFSKALLLPITLTRCIQTEWL